MKTNYSPLLAILIFFLVSLNIYMYINTKEQLALNRMEQPTFIWNDDLEGLPVDGTPIMLQYTEGDTIYLGVAEDVDPAQYQFIVTDDSITVTDSNRKVGTVKLEGQLEQLIINDNL